MGTNSIRLLNRRAAYFAAAIAMVFATLIPVLVSAAQVTDRSIALSSSSVQATGVSYNIKFTAAGEAEAFVVDFCANTPLYGQSCSTPADFTVASSTTATPNYTRTVVDANTVRFTKSSSIAADEDVDVVLSNVTNPSVAGPVYARIVTFDTDTNAQSYASAGANTGRVDDGSVAISITPTIGVTGAVLETMTFCVAKVTITENCANAAANPPTLKLGQDTGGVIALNSSDVYEGQISTQISTNASSGAIISLKSNALNCGGLLRAGAPSACDITPALAADNGIAAGQAKFGVKLGASGYATSGVTTADGTIQKYATSIYGSTNFALNYVAGNATGITSVYGDPILDTDELPANNQNMDLTFGASVSNTTPAGLYSADLSLIATGKF